MVTFQGSSTTIIAASGDNSTQGSNAVIKSIVSPAPRMVWQNLMVLDANSVPYQSPEWTNSACATGKFTDSSRLYEMVDGTRYVLPLLQPTGWAPQLSIAGSMPPAWGMGGVVGSRGLTSSALSSIVADLKQTSHMGIHLRPNPLNAIVWADAGLGNPTLRRAHVLDLTGGFDVVWNKRFISRVRNVVRKAEKSVQIEFDTSGRLMPVFYELFEKSVDRWAKKQNEPLFLARWRARKRDPFAKFAAIAANMESACSVGVASIDGKPVASIIVLLGQNANYSRGAMDVDLIGSTGANELLQSQAIKLAADAGCVSYHMGESGFSKNLSRFKEKFGAAPVDYAEFQLEKLPITKLKQASKAFVKSAIGFKDGQ